MAIAFGAYEGKSGTGTTATSDSITVSGSDVIGVVYIWVSDGNTLTAGTAKWNGVAMTGLTGNPAPNSGPSNTYCYWIANPGTGTITASFSANSNWDIAAAYYTGCDTSALDDQIEFENSATMSISVTGTYTQNGGWAIIGGRANYGTSATPSTNCTHRGEESNGAFLYDSNSAGTTGDITQTITDVNSAYISGYQVLLKMAGGTTGPTNLKSLDTNVKANIKSYNTNVLANIKSINTNA